MSTEPSGLGAAPSLAGPTGVTPRTQDAPRQGQRSSARERRPDGQAADRKAPNRAGGRKAPPRSRRKARMVHRVVRHVEVWSVAKIATAFAACGYVIGMVSGYLLWRAADRVGTIDGIEGFMEDSGGYDSFTILGDVVFRAAAIGGVILAVFVVAMAVLGAILFNLISDLTGGIRMTVIDEDLIVRPARRPEADPARRPEADPARRPEADPARRPEADTARRPEADTARRPERNGHAVDAPTSELPSRAASDQFP